MNGITLDVLGNNRRHQLCRERQSYYIRYGFKKSLTNSFSSGPVVAVIPAKVLGDGPSGNNNPASQNFEAAAGISRSVGKSPFRLLLFNAGRLKALFSSGLRAGHRPDELLLLSFWPSTVCWPQQTNILGLFLYDISKFSTCTALVWWASSTFLFVDEIKVSPSSNHVHSDGHKGIVCWTGGQPAGQGNNAGVRLERIGPFITETCNSSLLLKTHSPK